MSTVQCSTLQSRVEQQRRAVQSGVDESRIKESIVEQRLAINYEPMQHSNSCMRSLFVFHYMFRYDGTSKITSLPHTTPCPRHNLHSSRPILLILCPSHTLSHAILLTLYSPHTLYPSHSILLRLYPPHTPIGMARSARSGP